MQNKKISMSAGHFSCLYDCEVWSFECVLLDILAGHLRGMHGKWPVLLFLALPHDMNIRELSDLAQVGHRAEVKLLQAIRRVAWGWRLVELPKIYQQLLVW